MSAELLYVKEAVIVNFVKVAKCPALCLEWRGFDGRAIDEKDN